MSTIPGGCFVAPDSLRRYQQLQRQHARDAKLREANKLQAPTIPESPSPDLSPPSSPLLSRPSVERPRSSTFTQMFSNVPTRLSEMIHRTRTVSDPQSTTPATPPLSPRIQLKMDKPPTPPLAIPDRKLDMDTTSRSHSGSV